MSKVKDNPMKAQRVAAEIRECIAKGELTAGDRLPSLTELSKTMKVSQSAVYRGLLELVGEGLLESQRSRGFFVNDSESPAVPQAEQKTTAVAQQVKAPGRVYFSLGHHSDLVWKWPFSHYTAVRQKQLDFLCDSLVKYPSLCVYVEQARALEIYLEANPERYSVLHSAYQEGRLSLLGGYLIPDLNMASGELLIRNLQLGRSTYKKLFGKEPIIACENDAFGMIAQLPQILSHSGYRYLIPGRMPAANFDTSRNFCWKGIDGSTIPVIPWRYNVAHDCFSCNWTTIYDPTSTLDFTLDAIRNSTEEGNILAHMETEVEEIPPELFSLISSGNRRSGARRIDFGSVEDYVSTVDTGALPHYHGEFNPVFTGCYTTRCTVKQRFRSLENKIYAAEMLGALVSQDYDFTPSWRLLMECSFHDALCGCHSDSANHDIMAKLDEAECNLAEAMNKYASALPKHCIFNPGPAGWNIIKLPAATAKSLPGLQSQIDGDTAYLSAELPAHNIIVPKGASTPCSKSTKLKCASFETDFYKVDFKDGMPSILHKPTGQRVASGKDKLFGEILVRHEAGSLWTERIMSPYFGQELANESLVEIISGPVFQRVTTKGCFNVPQAVELYGLKSLKFQKDYFFFNHIDYFTLKLTIDFEGCDTKTSIRFPIPDLDVPNAHGIYAVPFAGIERAPYFEVEKKWASTLVELPRKWYADASGDYPALGWVDYSDLHRGLAVANRGTVGHQMVNGAILISLQRSGTMTKDGSLKPEPSSFDNGRHTFEFAFLPHGGNCLEEALSLGERFNHSPIYLQGKKNADLKTDKSISFGKSNIVISSIRKQGASLVIRAYESLGEHTACDFTGPQGTLSVSDLQEKEWTPCPDKNIVFAPYEIKTLRIEH